MARDVDLGAALSDEDRKYLMDRGRYAEVARVDQEFPPDDVPDLEDKRAKTMLQSGRSPEMEPFDPDASDDAEDYDQWTVSELQEELKARNLSPAGKKPELANRLRQADNA